MVAHPLKGALPLGIAALLLTTLAFAQERPTGEGVGAPESGAAQQFLHHSLGAHRAPSDVLTPASCTAPDPLKGTITLGVTLNATLGDSHSCFQSGTWVDLWTFSAPAGKTLHISYTTTNPSLAAVQDYTTGTILSESDTFCGGLAASCSFDYMPPSGGQYFFGFGSFSAENYSVTITASGGGGGGALPNLTPHKVNAGGSCTPPSLCSTNWSDKLVVSTTTATHTDSASLTTADSLYIDFAIINNGAGATATAFAVGLYVDGVQVQTWSADPPLGPNVYTAVQDYPLGSLSAGSHEIRIRADYTNAVPETNESDNEYAKNIFVSGAGPSGCTVTTTNLCLSGGRFKVEAAWQTPNNQSGNGTAIALTADSGYFWFFDPGNIELVVKVLNACSFDPHFWVFSAGLTNVRVVLTVTDTATGVVKQYVNPQGTAYLAIQDTAAFSTCPGR